MIGTTLDSLMWLESARGKLAAALLIGFGLMYAVWAGWRSLRGATHTHVHVHTDGTVHTHPHSHEGAHIHVHDAGRSFTPWALFVIFVFGPCEPLIPLMVVPAMSQSWVTLGAVVAVFGLLTVGTMVATVTVAYRGFGLADRLPLARYADLLAGLAVAASGAAVFVLVI